MRGWVSCSAYGERVDLLTDLTAHAFSLDTSHVWLDGTGTAATQEVTPDFWRNLVAGAGPRGTWLLGGGLRTEDTSSWDLHPEGECVFLLVTGAMAIVVDEGVAGERTIELSPGQACLVPRGVWHRQIVHEPSERVFLTAGAGTRMRPVGSEPSA